jgi:hypothetical protein
MKKILLKIAFSLWILFCLCLCLSPLFTYLRIKAEGRRLPQDYEINLREIMGNYEGRIFSANQVQPGTFAIIKDFEEAKSWGKDAIMYPRPLIRGVELSAYRPDSQTSGTFEKAIKKIEIPDSVWNDHFAVGQIERYGEKLILSPKISEDWSSNLWGVALGTGLFMGVVFLFVTGAACYPHKKARQE